MACAARIASEMVSMTLAFRSNYFGFHLRQKHLNSDGVACVTVVSRMKLLLENRNGPNGS
jgi:hypothetical protein